MFTMKYTLFLFSFVFIFAFTLIECQYSGSGRMCDHNRLQRCQQDVTSNIQDLGNTQNSGYSGISSGYQSSGGDTHARCSAIRQNLDCLLMETPSCHQNRSNIYDTRTGGSNYDNRYQNNPGDFIRRAKQTIERFCEQGGGGWRSAACFQRQDVRNCENQHGFSSGPPLSSSSACRNYQEFRDCVTRIVRQSCHSQDLQLMATYLIDKAGELSWTCPFSDSYHSSYDPSRMDSNYNNNDYRSGGSSYGSNYNPNYDNRNPYDPNRGSQNDPNRDRNYDSNRDRFGSGSTQYDRDRQYGSGSYGSGSGSGSSYNRDRINDPYYSGSQQYPGGSSGSIDRFGAGGVPLTDSCVDRAGYYVRTCEDTLIQRQRDAREGRSSNDVQRRICCALFFFRDCISRVVVDRCRDPSPTAVEILMGSRKRDLTVTCREYSRDQCSASSLIKSSFSVFLSLLVSIIFVKSKMF